MNRRLATGASPLAIILALFVTGCPDQGGGKAAPDAGGQKTGQQAAANPAAAGEGKTFFGRYCVACHGPEAKGLPNLGPDLTVSPFVAEKSDAELLDFVKKGRAIDDPLNKTGIPMPPKGGNPALKDSEIEAIIQFLRSIHS